MDDNASKRGPSGDALPDAVDPHRQKEGPLKPEKVEDRPNVGTVKPEDYPEDQRARGADKP